MHDPEIRFWMKPTSGVAPSARALFPVDMINRLPRRRGDPGDNSLS